MTPGYNGSLVDRVCALGVHGNQCMTALMISSQLASLGCLHQRPASRTTPQTFYTGLTVSRYGNCNSTRITAASFSVQISEVDKPTIQHTSFIHVIKFTKKLSYTHATAGVGNTEGNVSISTSTVRLSCFEWGLRTETVLAQAELWPPCYGSVKVLCAQNGFSQKLGRFSKPVLQRIAVTPRYWKTEQRCGVAQGKSMAHSEQHEMKGKKRKAK